MGNHKWRLIVIALFVHGCSALSGDTIDAGLDAASEGVPAEPQVVLPQLASWRCPTGWLPETVGEKWDVGHAICVPPKQLSCSEGQAQFLGETACRSIGTACPAEHFLAESEIRALAPGFGGRVIYAKAGILAGNGSRSMPWPSYFAAYNIAREGDIIALSRGTFDEMVLAHKRIAIVGSCVEGTIVEPPPRKEQRWIAIGLGDGGSGSLVTNLRVIGPRDGILAGDQGLATAPFVLRKIEVLGVTRIGITFTKGTIGKLDEVVIRQTRGGAEVGIGLAIDTGASVDADRVVLEDNSGFGIFARTSLSKPSEKTTFRDVVVRRTVEDPSYPDINGFGLVVGEGVNASVQRGLFEHNHRASVYTSRSDPAAERTTLAMTDVVVRSTEPRSLPGADGSLRGIGLVILDGSSVAVTRGVFDDNAWAAIIASRTPQGSSDNDITLDGLAVRRTTTAGDEHGAALYFEGATRVSLKRGYFEQNHSAAIRAIKQNDEETPPELIAEDLAIVETRSNDNARFGRGIVVVNGAKGVIERALLAANREAAVLAIADEGFPPPSIELTEVIVRDTAPARCAQIPEGKQHSCVQGGLIAGGGTGVSAAGGIISIDRFVSFGNAMSGLQVCRGGKVEASNGVVHHNAIGVHVTVDDYDLDTVINDSIRYYENDQNIGTASLPLPDVGSTVLWQ